MSAAPKLPGFTPRPVSVLAAAADLKADRIDFDPRNGAAIPRAHMARLRRAAEVGSVLCELMEADAENACMAGGEVLNNRQRSAFIQALAMVCDAAQDVADAAEPATVPPVGGAS